MTKLGGGSKMLDRRCRSLPFHTAIVSSRLSTEQTGRGYIECVDAGLT